MNFEQSKLNIAERSRTSRLPWRGQFSPEFIEYIINTVCYESEVIYDPFCGSGTVLFESSLLGKKSVGSEINPSAWCLSSLSTIVNYTKATQIEVKKKLNAMLYMDALSEIILQRIHDKNEHYFIRVALSAAILLGMRNGTFFNDEIVKKGLILVTKLLGEIHLYRGITKCNLEDARYSSLDNNSVDTIITSPPYINVFNYHQNYRPAIELLGWMPLDAAKSEIGANRKFRQNRFMTVIQYSLDMSMSINEMIRVSTNNAKLILVVGRESNVLGHSFENSKIIKKLIASTQSLNLISVNERVFKNKFGVNVSEDILIYQKMGIDNNFINKSYALKIGLEMIENSLYTAADKNIIWMKDAIEKANKIEPSQKLSIKNPLIEAM